MALTTTEVTELTDSIAQGIADYDTNVKTGLASAFSTIISGVSGQGATSATLGRVMAYASVPDLPDLLALLSKTKDVADRVSAYLNGLLTLNPIATQYFPVLDALDSQQGGLNAFLTAHSLQVNGYFALAFNLYVSLAVAMQYRTYANLPTQLSPGNYFPYAAVDDMWAMTVNDATTFTANAVGSHADTTLSGGGVGQIYIYKSNAGNAAGGATFTISYTNAAGATAQATYETVSGTPAASGSLSSGYAISGAVGSAITAVTGSGMTAGESYTLGIKLVRSPAY